MCRPFIFRSMPQSICSSSSSSGSYFPIRKEYFPSPSSRLKSGENLNRNRSDADERIVRPFSISSDGCWHSSRKEKRNPKDLWDQSIPVETLPVKTVARQSISPNGPVVCPSTTYWPVLVSRTDSITTPQRISFHPKPKVKVPVYYIHLLFSVSVDLIQSRETNPAHGLDTNWPARGPILLIAPVDQSGDAKSRVDLLPRAQLDFAIDWVSADDRFEEIKRIFLPFSPFFFSFFLVVLYLREKTNKTVMDVPSLFNDKHVPPEETTGIDPRSINLNRKFRWSIGIILCVRTQRQTRARHHILSLFLNESWGKYSNRMQQPDRKCPSGVVPKNWRLLYRSMKI